MAPRRLFASFGTGAPWFGALALATLAAMIATSAIPDAAFVDQLRNPIDRLGRPVTVTSDAATVGRWGRILAAFSALMFQPMLAFGLAGLLALVFGTLPRRPVAYTQYLAVTAHAMLVPALGSLVLLPFAFREFAGPVTLAVRFGFIAWGIAVAVAGARVLPRLRAAETFPESPP